jgi:hypothetical protein
MIIVLNGFRLWIALQEASKLIGECGFLGVSTDHLFFRDEKGGI